ncbi:MAG: carboxypeptidase regulatory-like domain-containing protein [Deltaproteobacteria bacterium]|nr:carboxypeptidase regulatory-like domain-containing protein [Deltaproteobacteria bacterium]
MSRSLRAFVVVAVAVVIVGIPARSRSAPQPRSDAIAGRVVSQGGRAEAGVWVIAEADGLPTEYRKIVVTNDEGKFVLPSLPAASYRVWVRGYGLRDSEKVAAKPGSTIEIAVADAATPQEAAKIYPANYWLSLLEPPAEAKLRGAPAGGGAGVLSGASQQAPAAYPSRAAWTAQFKLNCVLCHQIGSLLTRSRPAEMLDRGLRKAAMMSAMADMLGRERVIEALGGWSARIAAGTLPPAPPRPAGAERNVVITEWGWGDTFTYAHDEVATDKRDPTRYANGPVYGVDIGNDRLLKLDPMTHTASMTKVPTRDGFDTPWCRQTYQAPHGKQILPIGVGSLGCPAEGGESGFAGKYDNPANPHNPMMDGGGKVWMTTQIRREWAEDLPEFCKSVPEIAARIQHRQLGYYDTKAERFVLIDTCYGTHHLQFDAKGVLWTSGDSHVVGWFDPAKFDPAKPDSAGKAQGWSAVIVDSDGDGKKDTPVVGFHYGVIPNAADGSVWTAVVEGLTSPAGVPGRILRYDPATDTHEVFSPPAPGFGPRGLDADTRGNVWIGLGGSGHLAKFDRSKCAKTWGTGDQCPEGWTLWQSPGPQIQGLAPGPNGGSADFHYYVWVDQFDTLGMGRNTVILNGTGSDSLLAFDPSAEKFRVIRIPYPLNSYTRGLDGRIDDPAAGWKGRGLWFTNGLDPVLHSEVPRSYVGWVQFRPDPLAD